MEVIIAKKNDLKKIHELYCNWADEKISPKTGKISFDEIKGEFEKSTIIIAKENKEIMGFLICKIKKADSDSKMYKLKKGEEYAEIDSIYVAPRHRGKGIGTKLLKSCMDELKKHGHKKTIILADSINPKKLIDFYEKSGFKALFVSMIKEE